MLHVTHTSQLPMSQGHPNTGPMCLQWQSLNQGTHHTSACFLWAWAHAPFCGCGPPHSSDAYAAAWALQADSDVCLRAGTEAPELKNSAPRQLLRPCWVRAAMDRWAQLADDLRGGAKQRLQGLEELQVRCRASSSVVFGQCSCESSHRA